jgi:hypothetical protein
MALLTERALKRRKSAVIIVEAFRKNVLTGKQTADFEWFNKPDAAAEHADQFGVFAKEDAKAYTELDGDDPAMAYMVIVVPDTNELDELEIRLYPETDITKRWRDELIVDLSQLYTKAEAAPKKKVVVKAPRRRAVVVGKSDVSDEPKVKPRARVGVRRVKVAEDDE